MNKTAEMKKYSRSLKSPQVFYTVFPSPMGKIGLAATSKGICRLSYYLPGKSAFVEMLKESVHPNPVHKPEMFVDLVDQFDQYFAGKLDYFKCDLDLGLGTEFQSKTWKKLTTIPYGKTRSYHWLAKSVGKPLACRAVGNANGKNPIPIIVPCHRVIRKNGDLGGFTGGLQFKRFLLNLEQGTANGIV
jgi:O-6-methylguanine DNA methyltransferase